MSLAAAEASEILLTTSEEGGTAVTVLVVGGAVEAWLGQRMALVHHAGSDRPEARGELGSGTLEREARAVMQEAVADPRAGDGLRSVTAAEGEVELYLEIRRPVQELVIVGAGHIAQPLAHTASLLGFRVTVLDDRPDFATRERFPDAHRVVRADFDDPFADLIVHERSHILLVTRGHKYDYQCLVRALRMDPLPAYVGMIGSRRRVRATFAQLLDDGIPARLLERIHAPVGLDVGAETPEEIAVAIAAELVMVRRGGSGAPLRDVERIAERFFPKPSETPEGP